jgi:peptidoglycan/LPS O-acetylase OafA/YrhL
MTRNRSLDGIRAFAILAVIGSHLRLPAMAGGGIGVNIFFVLSGFLITSLLMQERDRAGRIWLRNFYARRALRLFPALAVLIAVVTAYTLLVLGPETHGSLLRAIPFVVFYLGNWRRAFEGADSLSWFGHTWSLSIEEQFYLIWPVILIVVARRRGRRGVLSVAVVGSVISLVIRLVLWAKTGSVDRIYNGTDTEADQLLYGCALAVALSLYPDAVRRACRLGVWPGLALLTVGVVNVDHLGLRYTIGWTAFALSSACLIGHVVLEPEAALARLLAFRPLAFTGLISYGLYLWHFPLVLGAEGHLHNKVLLSLFVVIASYLTAYTSWRLIEQPALRFKHHFPPAQAATSPSPDRIEANRPDAADRA